MVEENPITGLAILAFAGVAVLIVSYYDLKQQKALQERNNRRLTDRR